MADLCRRIRAALDETPVADVHSHLGGLRQAQTLADIVSYHWLSVELARAKGGRIDASPREDPEGYLREVVPFFPAIRNTVNHYAFLGILHDLYGFQDRTLTQANWPAADAAVRAHAADPAWLAATLDRGRLGRILVPIHDGMPDASVRYVPYEYAEPLYALRSPEPFQQMASRGLPVPQTPEELAEAIGKRLDWLAAEKGVRALHVWAPGTWAYRPVEAADVADLVRRLAAGERLAEAEADTMASFAADATAAGAARHGMVIQLFHGSLRYTRGATNASYWNPEFLRSLTRHFERHPETAFDLFLATRLPSHEAALLSRSYPNLMVSGAWWHGFTPTTLLTFFRDRLEMLPNTAWNAFYSDGYIVEWVYGKLLVTKNRLALALAGMAEEEFLTEEDALDIARRVLWDNPVRAYGMEA
jgi:hypothetical protein